MSDPQKPARKYGSANLVYDIEAADSLITPRQFQQRQDKLAKFQRRAAHPNPRREYYHVERVRLIDDLLLMSTDGDMIGCMIACLELAEKRSFGPNSIKWGEKEKRFKRAIAVLIGDEITDRMVANPAPEADAAMVNDYLARLSDMSDPYDDQWDSANQCYFIRCYRGFPHLGINEDDQIGVKPKTPEPGDMVILPDSKGHFYIGYYISGDAAYVTLAVKDGLKRFQVEDPPLVVSRIRPHGSDT